MVLCLVLVVLEGVAASGPVMVGLAESSPGWWQKMAAVGWAKVSRGGGRRWSCLLTWLMHFTWLEMK